MKLIRSPYRFIRTILCLSTLVYICNTIAVSPQLLDLQSTTSSFSSEAAGWTIEGAISTDQYTQCGSTYLEGGYDILGFSGAYAKTFTSLPVHSSVFITADVVLIDNWSSNDKIGVTILSGTESIGFSSMLAITGGSTAWSTQLCGESAQYDQAQITLTVQVQHSSSTLPLYFTKISDTGTGQFGIRNLRVISSTRTITSSNMCFYTEVSDVLPTGSSCACNAGYYKDQSSSSCQVCDSSCETCSGPSKSECLSCATGLTYNGETCILCDSSCVTCFGTEKNQCLTCPAGSYLFSDFTCQAPCEAPNIIVEENGVLHCDLCYSGNTVGYNTLQLEDYYYYIDDQTCKPTCPKPFISQRAGRRASCFLPISEETAQQLKTLSSSASTAGDVMTGGLVAVTVLQPSSSSATTTGQLAKMFEYTRYIEVTRSVKLEYFYLYKRPTPGTLTFIPKKDFNSVSGLAYQHLPQIFEMYGVYSSFLANFWQSLITLIVIFTLFLVLLGLEIYVRKKFPQHLEKFVTIKISAEAFFLTQFYNAFGDIIFFFLLDARASVKYGSALTCISFIIGLVLVFLVVTSLILHTRLLRGFKELKNDKDKIEKYEKENAGVKPLYQDYKNATMLQQSYLLILTIRTVIVSLVIGLLFSYPLAQALIITLMNLATLIYLVLKLPFKNFFSQLQQIVLELNLLVVNLCILIAACMDLAQTATEKSRESIGEAIIVSIYANKFVPLVSLIPKIIEGCITAYKKFKEKKKVEETPTDANSPTAAHLNTPDDQKKEGETSRNKGQNFDDAARQRETDQEKALFEVGLQEESISLNFNEASLEENREEKSIHVAQISLREQMMSVNRSTKLLL